MRLENKTNSHYKFYELHFVPGPSNDKGKDIFALIVKWGKINSLKPRQETKKIGTFTECQKEFEYLYKKREHHGYISVLNHKQINDKP